MSTEIFLRLWTRAPRIDKESSTTIESIAAQKPSAFRKQLLSWYDASARRLPWREQHDPYRIWLSEVMLQQTRVAAVIPYYERFLSRFPTIERLAAAPGHDLLQAWAGLGYYSRARNLQKAAVQMAELGGFPADYDSIRALPGVGEYTAAAVASIAFNIPYAAVDGNVKRVVARLLNSEEDTRWKAQTLLDPTRPGDFNQAMMELGATICLPRNPQCLLCPVAGFCRAREAGTQEQIPVSKRAKLVRVERSILVIRDSNNQLLFWQRPATDRKLAGFWELPEREQLPQARIGAALGKFRHSITNFNNIFTIYDAQIVEKPEGYAWIPLDNPLQYVLSTSARKALRILSQTNGVEVDETNS